MDKKQEEVFEELHQLIKKLMENRITPEIEAQILKERAEKLGKSLDIQDTGEKIDLVIFQIADEFFAMDAQFIYEVRAISEITPVPCTPDFVLGITNIRGMIYSVIDIRSAFNLEDQAVTDKSMFMVLHWKNMEVCVLVDAIKEKIALPKREIKSFPVKEGVNNYLSGFFITDNKKITILNWDEYLRQANIVVNEEV